MKVIRDAHRYELENFERPNEYGQVIQFIEKEPIAEGSSELRTVSDGTTNEEVLAVLIDRLKKLNARVPSRESAIAITNLEQAEMWLQKRTQERKVRGVEGTNAK